MSSGPIKHAQTPTYYEWPNASYPEISQPIGPQSYYPLRRMLSRIFGFLRAGEFTVNSCFDPAVHLSVSDIQADSLIQGPLKNVLRQILSAKVATPTSQLASLTCTPRRPNSRPSSPPFRQHPSDPYLLSSSGIPGLAGSFYLPQIRVATTATSCGLPDRLIKNLGTVIPMNLMSPKKPRFQWIRVFALRANVDHHFWFWITWVLYWLIKFYEKVYYWIFLTCCQQSFYKCFQLWAKLG